MDVLPAIDRHATDAFKRFYALLPRSPDIVLVILKVHLLVEEQVRAYVDERVSDSASLKNANLTCHQAIWLAEALCMDGIHSNVWEASRKLNELRNQVAHKLEPAGVLARMDNFCSLVGFSTRMRKEAAPTPTPSPLDDFELAGSILYNNIALYVKKKPAGAELPLP